MGVKRYELSEAQRVRIAPMLPGKRVTPVGRRRIAMPASSSRPANVTTSWRPGDSFSLGACCTRTADAFRKSYISNTYGVGWR